VRRLPGLALPALLLTLLAPPLSGQSLEVRPEQTTVTIGDPVTLDVTVRLPPGMSLIDAVPHTLVPPPKGIRLLGADSLRPKGAGVLVGKARVAFYRIGLQPVPTLALLYRDAPGSPPDTLLHLPVSVQIAPILEPGNPRLKDIKPPRPVGGPAWGALVLLIGLVTGSLWWVARARRSRGSPRQEAESTRPSGPFEIALARLAELEAAARSSGNGVVPLYEGVADVIRDCLLASGAIPHPGLTTLELTASLRPPFDHGDLPDRCRALLRDADLVKFARHRPDRESAHNQAGRARALIQSWRAGLSDGEAPGA
jgi:hypothetical protein